MCLSSLYPFSQYLFSQYLSSLYPFSLQLSGLDLSGLDLFPARALNGHSVSSTPGSSAISRITASGRSASPKP